MPTNRSRRDFLKKSATLVLGTTATSGTMTTPATRALAFEKAAAGSATVPASTTSMFDGFKTMKIQTGDARIRLVVGGSGPPVLVLHGYPQTHMMWHKIAPPLTQEFLVVAVLALWGERGAMHRLYNVLETWRERATHVSGKALPSGHFVPEEAPDETLVEIRSFLSS